MSIYRNIADLSFWTVNYCHLLKKRAKLTPWFIMALYQSYYINKGQKPHVQILDLGPFHYTVALPREIRKGWYASSQCWEYKLFKKSTPLTKLILMGSGFMIFIWVPMILTAVNGQDEAVEAPNLDPLIHHLNPLQHTPDIIIIYKNLFTEPIRWMCYA